MDFTELELDCKHIHLNGTAITSTAAELNIMDGVTATAAEINAAADVGGRIVDIADADTYTFLVADSGKQHVVSAITGDMAFTLPAAAAGLEFKLMHGGIVAEADNWTFTTTGDDPFAGGILWLDEDAGAADGVDTVLPDGTDDFMTIVDPSVGTSIRFISNGTVWYVDATIVSTTIPTFTTP
jgi:hypothetical protein